MAPPLVLLQDIRFAGRTTALLRGPALSVSPGERLALVGRNGSGKSTLLRIAAGPLAPEGGTRLLQPGTPPRHPPQERDSVSPARHHAALSRAGAGFRRGGDGSFLRRSGSGTGRRPLPGTVPPRATRPHGRGGPAALVRWRGPAGGAGASPGPLARHPAARRADEPPGPPSHLLAGSRVGRVPLGAGVDQPRPALPPT